MSYFKLNAPSKKKKVMFSITGKSTMETNYFFKKALKASV